MIKGKVKVGAGEFVDVGKVKSAHGLRGEVYIIIFSREFDWLPEAEVLRLHKDISGGEARSWELSVEKYRVHKDGFIAKFKGIDDRNQSEELKGALLEISGSLLVSGDEDDLFLNEVLQYSVHVEGLGEIGKVIDFSSNGEQDLLVVKTAKGEYEVPFVEAFTVKIDKENEVIYLDLPEGLVEV